MSFGRGGSRTVNDFGDQSDLRGSNYTNYRDNNGFFSNTSGIFYFSYFLFRYF